MFSYNSKYHLCEQQTKNFSLTLSKSTTFTYTIRRNFGGLLCKLQERCLQCPQTSHQCLSSSPSKVYVYLHIPLPVSTINFKARSMLLCYTLKPYRREPLLSNSNTEPISSSHLSKNLTNELLQPCFLFSSVCTFVYSPSLLLLLNRLMAYFGEVGWFLCFVPESNTRGN